MYSVVDILVNQLFHYITTNFTKEITGVLLVLREYDISTAIQDVTLKTITGTSLRLFTVISNVGGTLWEDKYFNHRLNLQASIKKL